MDVKQKSCCIYKNLVEYFGRLEKGEVTKKKKKQPKKVLSIMFG